MQYKNKHKNNGGRKRIMYQLYIKKMLYVESIKGSSMKRSSLIAKGQRSPFLFTFAT